MRTVVKPEKRGVGDGKAVYFLYGFKRDKKVDRKMMEEDLESIQDDLRLLSKRGFTSVVDLEADRFALRAALYGKDRELDGLQTAAVYWSGHGARDGSLETNSRKWINPQHIDPERVAEALKFVIFSSCHTGKHRRIWKRQIGEKVLIIAWNRALWQTEAIDFNTPDEASQSDLDDLIRRLLIDGEDPSNVTLPDENWEDEEYDPGEIEHYDDAAEDNYWDGLFAGLRQAIGRGVASYAGQALGIGNVEPLLAAAGGLVGAVFGASSGSSRPPGKPPREEEEEDGDDPWECPGCDHPLILGKKRCPECGERIDWSEILADAEDDDDDPWECPKCDHPLIPGKKRCPRCGERIDWSDIL